MTSLAARSCGCTTMGAATSSTSSPSRCAGAFGLQGLWGFRWCLWCSRPRLEGYGGGAKLLDLGRRRSLDWLDCER